LKVPVSVPVAEAKDTPGPDTVRKSWKLGLLSAFPATSVGPLVVMVKLSNVFSVPNVADAKASPTTKKLLFGKSRDRIISATAGSPGGAITPKDSAAIVKLAPAVMLAASPLGASARIEKPVTADRTKTKRTRDIGSPPPRAGRLKGKDFRNI
jgi:hypothetical protein